MMSYFILNKKTEQFKLETPSRQGNKYNWNFQQKIEFFNKLKTLQLLNLLLKTFKPLFPEMFGFFYEEDFNGTWQRKAANIEAQYFLLVVTFFTHREKFKGNFWQKIKFPFLFLKHVIFYQEEKLPFTKSLQIDKLGFDYF